jgi:5-bromo-4-chloroindolyl phosphate hydrolysis protein
VDLTDNYVEINGHEVKSKEVYGKLEESAQIIDQMADLIVKDYQQFVAEDLEDMDVEISIAKKNLDQDSDLTTKLKTKNS